ncbi:hypothetical protein [Holzapfeliella sp. JNUCC 72]
MRQLFALFWLVLGVIYLFFNISDLFTAFSFKSVFLSLVALFVIAISIGDLKNNRQ